MSLTKKLRLAGYVIFVGGLIALLQTHNENCIIAIFVGLVLKNWSDERTKEKV